MGDDDETRDGSDSTMLFEEHKDAVERPILRLFLEYGRDRKGLVLVAVLASVISPIVSLVPTYTLSIAIDAVLLGDGQFAFPGIPTAWLPTEQLAQLYLIVAIIAIAAVASTVLAWVSGWTWMKFSQDIQHAVRVDAYEKIQHLGMDFFENQQTGQILSILNNDVNRLNSILENTVGNLLRIGAQFLGIAAVLLFLHWQLALISLVVIPALGAMSRFFVKRVKPRYEQVRQLVGAVNARIENNLSGMSVIKSYATEPYEADRVEAASEDVYEKRMEVMTTRIAFFPAMDFVNWMNFCLLLVVGGIWITHGPPLFFTKPLSVGVLVSFLVYNQQLTRPMIQAGRILNRYYAGRASVVRIFALRDYDVEVTNEGDETSLDRVDGRVEMDSVSFSYRGYDEPALEEVSFETEPGQFVGIVGPTGAGKTTLMKLLLRFYDPDEGRITVDGRDIQRVNVRSLRKAIGMVSQDPYLFSGTIRENIAYADPDATDEEIERAARLANAHDFITGFDEGYDAQVGQRGDKLSGGQRQRIAIARVVLKDPDILILDEATSHVDNKTEALIQQSLAEVTADRTTFAIAHQLSTVRHADLILVLDGGVLVEQGTHEELVEQDGLYADLWRMQTGEFAAVTDEFLGPTVD